VLGRRDQQRGIGARRRLGQVDVRHDRWIERDAGQEGPVLVPAVDVGDHRGLARPQRGRPARPSGDQGERGAPGAAADDEDAFHRH
jgi:hypothetical protein